GTQSRPLAEEIEIPFNHFNKLTRLLARRGFIATRKGKGGGLKLARDPKKITLMEVIEAVEGPIILNHCLFHRRSCRFSVKCRVRKTLCVVQKTMKKMLTERTIHDMLIA
ncbi:MAG: Rrf2 family transcriptional regulator, partial [Candidatus Margulisbacteria bacterium]|nr:Rrf2 family transcriptional regulator [Candidatus Margulisiibacteriota bacterium]